MATNDDEKAALQAYIRRQLLACNEDVDALLDYTVALLSNRMSSFDELRKHAKEKLAGMLSSDSDAFVDKVVDAVENRSFLQGYKPAPKTSSIQTPSKVEVAPATAATESQPVTSKRSNEAVSPLTTPVQAAPTKPLDDDDRDWRRQRRGSEEGSGEEQTPAPKSRVEEQLEALMEGSSTTSASGSNFSMAPPGGPRPGSFRGRGGGMGHRGRGGGTGGPILNHPAANMGAFGPRGDFSSQGFGMNMMGPMGGVMPGFQGMPMVSAMGMPMAAMGAMMGPAQQQQQQQQQQQLMAMLWLQQQQQQQQMQQQMMQNAGNMSQMPNGFPVLAASAGMQSAPMAELPGTVAPAAPAVAGLRADVAPSPQQSEDADGAPVLAGNEAVPAGHAQVAASNQFAMPPMSAEDMASAAAAAATMFPMMDMQQHVPFPGATGGRFRGRGRGAKRGPAGPVPGADGAVAGEDEESRGPSRKPKWKITRVLEVVKLNHRFNNHYALHKHFSKVKGVEEILAGQDSQGEPNLTSALVVYTTEDQAQEAFSLLPVFGSPHAKIFYAQVDPENIKRAEKPAYSRPPPGASAAKRAKLEPENGQAEQGEGEAAASAPEAGSTGGKEASKIPPEKAKKIEQKKELLRLELERRQLFEAAIKQQEELLKKLDAPGVSDAEKLALLERLQEQDKILEELRSLANATSKAANKPKPSAPTAEQGPQTSEAATEPAVASAVQAAPAPVTSTEQSMHARGRYFSGAPRGRGMYMSRGRGRGRGRGPATTVLRVTGFAPEDKDELTPHFACFGEIVSVVLKNSNTEALVTFKSRKTAEQTVNSVPPLNGRALHVDWYNPSARTLQLTGFEPLGSDPDPAQAPAPAEGGAEPGEEQYTEGHEAEMHDDGEAAHDDEPADATMEAEAES